MLIVLLLVLQQTTALKKYVMELPQLNISDGVSLHIISPEPIQFVDLY
jgi:hypothetical protein